MGYIGVMHVLGGFNNLVRQMNSGLKGFFRAFSGKILLNNIRG